MEANDLNTFLRRYWIVAEWHSHIAIVLVNILNKLYWIQGWAQWSRNTFMDEESLIKFLIC